MSKQFHRKNKHKYKKKLSTHKQTHRRKGVCGDVSDMGMPNGYITLVSLLCIYRDHVQVKISDSKITRPWTRRFRKAQD